jgi:hypothetical protein
MPFVARCEIRQEGRVIPCLICNFSAHGCFLHVDPVPSGEFDLAFPLPDSGPLVEARVAVTWVNQGTPASAAGLPTGCGVRFVLMDPDDRRRVETLVDAFRRMPCLPTGAEQADSPAARVPLIAPCTLEGDFGVARGSTSNLSMFGIYAAVDPIPAVGSRVRVRVELPRRRRTFERWATVTWQNLEHPSWERPLPPGCGLRFEDLSLHDVTYLSSLVEEYLAQQCADSG